MSPFSALITHGALHAPVGQSRAGNRHIASACERQRVGKWIVVTIIARLSKKMHIFVRI